MLSCMFASYLAVFLQRITQERPIYGYLRSTNTGKDTYAPQNVTPAQHLQKSRQLETEQHGSSHFFSNHPHSPRPSSCFSNPATAESLCRTCSSFGPGLGTSGFDADCQLFKSMERDGTFLMTGITCLLRAPGLTCTCRVQHRSPPFGISA